MSRPTLRPLLVVFALLLSCASQRAQPERRELAGTRDEELAAAFGPPESEAPAGAAAPVAEHNVPALSEPPEDPSAAARARFSEQLAAADARLRAQDLAGARGLLPELERLSEVGGAPCDEQLRELGFRLAFASDDPAAAKTAAKRWLLACGPVDADDCRGRALQAYQRVSATEAGPLSKADACLRQAEVAAGRRRPRMPDCLEWAKAVYRKEGDRLMVARAQLAQALETAADAKKADAAALELRRAERACGEPRCLGVRRGALAALALLHLKSDRPEPAARAALDSLKLLAAMTPPAQRTYLRPAEVERACAALDERQGRGACRKLEKVSLGSYSFRDFSREKVGEGLAKEKISPVNEHYGVLIEECLTAQAGRLVPPASATYRVRWQVLNDGKVDGVHLEPNDLDQSPLASCLRAQFALWRYPQYTGEWQHIEQSFSIRAGPRR